MMVETYLRRGQRRLERLMLDPTVRALMAVLAYGGSGFLLSAVSLANLPQALAPGLICAGTGWRALVMSLGAMVGYPFFWGRAGNQGIVWSAAAGMLALLLGKREETKEQPLMIPAITALLVAVTGLVFRLMLREETAVLPYFLRVGLTFCSGVLFTQALRCRDSITDWLVGGVAVLALAQIVPLPGLNLGCIAAGVAASSGAFPAAALAGMGLDLARITPVPMTAVTVIAFFLRMIPFDRKWQHYAVPGFSCLMVMAVCGVWDRLPLPGLILGGAMGALVPPRPGFVRRRGDTGIAQVRLELGAEVLRETQHLLLQTQPPPIDTEALLQKAADRACAGCSARKTCTQKENITLSILQSPLDADCRKPGRLLPELHRAREQLNYLQADRRRQGEYRSALIQQYRFLGDFLRSLADELPRRGENPTAQFRVEAAARSRGKERANGDRCVAFPGPGCKFFLLLCDGMGTGLGAAQEGYTAAASLQRMLRAGFPPDHALKTLNSLLVLGANAGAVTVDLAEIRLDTGLAVLYKWGAAPSWLLRRDGAEKIGTATPPPGLSMEERPETVEKLSLRRGEALIMISDGVDGEDVLSRLSVTPDAPPGELAAEILERGCQRKEDDATAAVIRLRPVSLGTS